MIISEYLKISASQMDPVIPIILSSEFGFPYLTPASPQLDSGTKSTHKASHRLCFMRQRGLVLKAV